jgi:hypothetical protein
LLESAVICASFYGARNRHERGQWVNRCRFIHYKNHEEPVVAPGGLRRVATTRPEPSPEQVHAARHAVALSHRKAFR